MRPRDPLPTEIEADAGRLARIALAEDGAYDVTTDVVDVDSQARGHLVVGPTSAVAAGLWYAAAVCTQVACQVDWNVTAGDRIEPGGAIGTIRGPLGAVLRAERPVLNMLGRASGIATATRGYVDALAGTGCVVLHTRKTAPGLRLFDVQAVVDGGGARHRLGLDGEVMVKDNHWVALSYGQTSLSQALATAVAKGIRVLHVEVEDASQVREAIDAGATRILIDNRSPEEFRELAAVARGLNADVELEATGGLTVDTVRAYAASGAQFVSIGALTHSVVAAGIGLEVELPAQ